MPKKPKKITADNAKLWASFFREYGHRLDREQKKSYKLMMQDDLAPPPAESLKDLPPNEILVISKHMGSTIKKYREKAGLTQEYFAKAIDKLPSHVSLIESGDKMFRVIDLAKVIEVLKIPAQELFSYHE